MEDTLVRIHFLDGEIIQETEAKIIQDQEHPKIVCENLDYENFNGTLIIGSEFQISYQMVGIWTPALYKYSGDNTFTQC